MATVAVLGATGFIGTHVVAGFLAQGWSVVAGSRSGAPTASLRSLQDHVAGRLEVVQADLGTITGSAIWDVGPDLVVNCAGYAVNPRETDVGLALSVNALAVAALVEHCRMARVARVIHLGSAAEYAPSPAPIPETGATATAGLYGTTKLAGTLIAVRAAEAAGVDLCVVRPFGCYGPGESAGKFVPGLLSAAAAGRPIDLSPGTQLRDYTFVADVVDAIAGLAAPEHGVAGQVFNICSGRAVSIRQLGEAALMAFGQGVAPDVARWGAIPMRPTDGASLVGDGSKLFGVTGWRPTTTLSDGMQAVVAALS